MAYQTLYRKYRPSNFNLVFGQNVIVKTLKNIIKNEKIGHAYLFTGPRGTGKTSCAKLFAKAINCTNNVDGDACDKCSTCKTFINNSNPDIIEIDAASNNGVDEIREIRNKVNLVPSMSKYKVYIIDEVHMLTIGAFNALLKTLEEPPEYIIFILATTEPQKIPSTIISRCQRFDFKNISPDNMKKCLENITKKEKINIEKDALDEIIYNSNGGMRDAIGMLDQAFAFCDDKICKSDIEVLSGSMSDSEIYEYIEKILENNVEFIVNKNEELANEGKDFETIASKTINLLRKELISMKISQKNAFKCKDKQLIELIDSYEELLSKLKITNNKRLIFDVEIIKMLNTNVSRETLPDKIVEKQLNEYEITNILVKATKENLSNTKEKWKTIKNYLLKNGFKIPAGLLMGCEPVASSDEEILIKTEDESILSRVNKYTAECENLLNTIFNSKKHIVCIDSDFWSKKRPIYAKQIKNNELKYHEIEKNNTKSTDLNEFGEFIEIKED